MDVYTLDISPATTTMLIPKTHYAE